MTQQHAWLVQEWNCACSSCPMSAHQIAWPQLLPALVDSVQTGKMAKQMHHARAVSFDHSVSVLVCISWRDILVVVSLSQDEDFFHKIPEPTEDELDMLDLAFGLQET